MAMTQAQAVEQVRARLAEEQAGFHKDSQIRSWLNEGVREVARRSEWKRTSRAITTAAEDSTYPLPFDVIRTYRVEWQTSDGTTYRLEYRDLNQLDTIWGTGRRTSVGYPEFYTLLSANPYIVEVAPSPSSAGTLNVYYYAMPSDLAVNTTDDASSTLDVPGGWEDLVVEYATGLGFRKARNAQDYQFAMASFTDKLAGFIELAQRGTDEPTMFVPESNWGWGGGGAYDGFF